MSHAAAERWAAGRDTGIGLQRLGMQHVNDDHSVQRDKPRRDECRGEAASVS